MSKATTQKEQEQLAQDDQEQVTKKIAVITGFSACEDGCVVNTYLPGEYESLPPVALEHGLAISAFSDESVEIAKAALAEAKQKSEE